jgi:hypothetical protein
MAPGNSGFGYSQLRINRASEDQAQIDARLRAIAWCFGKTKPGTPTIGTNAGLSRPTIASLRFADLIGNVTNLELEGPQPERPFFFISRSPSSPEVLERRRTQLRIARRVLDRDPMQVRRAGWYRRGAFQTTSA